MFEIEYKGGNGLVITTKKSKLVVDPKLSVVGLKDLSSKGAIEMATEDRFLVRDADALLAIEGPGEFEAGDFSIRGIPATRHIDTETSEAVASIYRIDVGDARIVLLGNVAGKLTEDQLEAIGVVDIAIIPVGGGGYTLDHVSAARLVRQIDPKIVIPVHYAESGVKYEVPQEQLDLFTKELGVPVETSPKFKLKSIANLPATMSIAVIQRS